MVNTEIESEVEMCPFTTISIDQNLLEFHSEILELVKPQNMLEIIRQIGATSIQGGWVGLD